MKKYENIVLRKTALKFQHFYFTKINMKMGIETFENVNTIN